MIDSAKQRSNMVESQIRPSDVTDRRILRAMQDVPREQYVPDEVRSLAYMDEAVPLMAPAAGRPNGALRTLMSPRAFAKLVQLLDVGADDRVLIVGAGRGYSVAVLAKLAGAVVGLESDETLAASAKTALGGISNVTVSTGSLPVGAPETAPFDCIFVEGTIWERPMALLGQLKPGGRLAAVLHDGSVGNATVWRRVGDQFGQTTAFEAAASPLPGFERTKVFVL